MDYLTRLRDFPVTNAGLGEDAPLAKAASISRNTFVN
jgi:hypothetical protein